MENPELESNLLSSKSKSSKIPLIILVLSFFLLVACLIILILVLIQVKNQKSNEKEETPKKTTGKTPIIGFTGKRVPEGNETINMTETDTTTDMIQIHYIEAIEKAGGITIGLPIPQEFNVDIIEKQLEIVDGILVQGGLDVDPSFYGEPRDPLLGKTNVKSDIYTIEVLKRAKDKKIPILGICRGHQILNVAFGGTLYQDLSRAGKEVIHHRNKEIEFCLPTHSITLNENTLLSKLFPNNKTLQVNSWHHQAVNKVAANFEVDAMSDDGLIESIHYKSDEQWILGVQFHPEQLIRCEGKAFMAIFNEFMKEAQKYKDNKKD